MLNQEPNIIVQQPEVFSTAHPQTMALGQGVSIIFIRGDTRITMQHVEPGPGQGVTGDNAMETFALILAPAHGTTSPPGKNHINPDINILTPQKTYMNPD